MRSPRLLYDGSYHLINRHCLAGARLTWPSPRLAGSEELEAAKAGQAGRELQWHCSRVTRLGNFEVASNTVTILWEAGDINSPQGNMPEEQSVAKTGVLQGCNATPPWSTHAISAGLLKRSAALKIDHHIIASQ